MLQEKLKSATKAHHDDLEQLMFVNHIMDKTLTLTQYHQLLMTNYLVHEQVEPVIFKAIGDKMVAKLNLAKREKLSALRQDVQQAGLKLSDLPQPAIDVAFINDEATALGALYVLEGATLGGNVIYKKLKMNEALAQRGLTFAYYSVYQEALMPNWIAFVQHLNTLPEANHEKAVKGAAKMFETIAEVAKQVKAQFQ